MNRHRDDLALVMDSADLRRDSHVRARQPGLAADLENVIVRPTIMLHERRYERRVEAAAGMLARQAAKLHALLAEPLTRPLGSMQTPRCFANDEAITLIQSKPRLRSEEWQLPAARPTREAQPPAPYSARPIAMHDRLRQEARPTAHAAWMHDAEPQLECPAQHARMRDLSGPMPGAAPPDFRAQPAPTRDSALAYAEDHSLRARMRDASLMDDVARHAAARDVQRDSVHSAEAMPSSRAPRSPAARRAWSRADQPLHPEYPAQPALMRATPRAPQDDADTYHGLRRVRDQAHARLESLEAAAASGRTAAARPNNAGRARNDTAGPRALARTSVDAAMKARLAAARSTEARRARGEGLTNARNELRRAYAASKLRLPNAPPRSSAQKAGVVDGWERLPDHPPHRTRPRAVWPWAVALALSSMLFAYTLTLTVVRQSELATLTQPNTAMRSDPNAQSELAASTPVTAVAMPVAMRTNAPSSQALANADTSENSTRPRAFSSFKTPKPATRAAARSECREPLQETK